MTLVQQAPLTRVSGQRACILGPLCGGRYIRVQCIHTHRNQAPELVGDGICHTTTFCLPVSHVRGIVVGSKRKVSLSQALLSQGIQGLLATSLFPTVRLLESELFEAVPSIGR